MSRFSRLDIFSLCSNSIYSHFAKHISQNSKFDMFSLCSNEIDKIPIGIYIDAPRYALRYLVTNSSCRRQDISSATAHIELRQQYIENPYWDLYRRAALCAALLMVQLFRLILRLAGQIHPQLTKCLRIGLGENYCGMNLGVSELL